MVFSLVKILYTLTNNKLCILATFLTKCILNRSTAVHWYSDYLQFRQCHRLPICFLTSDLTNVYYNWTTQNWILDNNIFLFCIALKKMFNHSADCCRLSCLFQFRNLRSSRNCCPPPPPLDPGQSSRHMWGFHLLLSLETKLIIATTCVTMRAHNVAILESIHPPLLLLLIIIIPKS